MYVLSILEKTYTLFIVARKSADHGKIWNRSLLSIVNTDQLIPHITVSRRCRGSNPDIGMATLLSGHFTRIFALGLYRTDLLIHRLELEYGTLRQIGQSDGSALANRHKIVMHNNRFLEFDLKFLGAVIDLGTLSAVQFHIILADIVSFAKTQH